MKKKILIGLGAVIIFILFLIIGPLDVLSHGFYYDEIDYSVVEESVVDTIDLSEGYEMTFIPQQKHFKGFVLNLINSPYENPGILNLDIYKGNKQIERVEVALNAVQDRQWYKVRLTSELKKGTEYKLVFSIDNGVTSTCLQLLENNQFIRESIGTPVLINYAYSESVFNCQDKILWFLLMLVVELAMLYCFADKPKLKRILKRTVIYLLLVFLMSWNYVNNSLDKLNVSFDSFQKDSDSLIMSAIGAQQYGIETGKYGNGFLYTTSGEWYAIGEESDYVSDENWSDGFSKSEPQIAINSNMCTQELMQEVEYVEFENGKKYHITEKEDDGLSINLCLDTNTKLNKYTCGEISNAAFYNADGESLPNAKYTSYTSQVGLQGKVFSLLGKIVGFDDVWSIAQVICCLLLANILVMLCILLKKKYSYILAGCFYITFLLSPWIVNFAKSIYWVEFTWFIPMLVGLLCAYKIENRRYRMFCYFMSYVSILIKCLCGYEYISSIMLSMISFLLVDLILAFIERKTEAIKQLFVSILIMGIMALAAFATALLVHAAIRGDGQIMEGIRLIIEQDVLRRTSGGDLNLYDGDTVLLDSFNVSVWEVLCRYFKFDTQIITGMPGNLFPIICILPLAVFAYQYKKRVLATEDVLLYMVFFVVTLSWIVLAKAHSYVHTHMNFVLWYFGYIQICFYCVLNAIVKTVKLKRK